MTLRYGSLFSGYGGLEMGVQSVLGGTTAWFCEFDKAPSKILAHHWPDVPNLGDITTVDWATVEPVDVLTGGFPCQDVSHAGRRAGLIRDGEGRTRSGLWGHMLRAIDELRPSLVVAENVRGLLSARADSDVEPCPWCMGDAEGEPHLRALGAVLADLADVGYDAAWYGLRAADVGAAHGRFRVFIFATPADAEPLSFGQHRDAGGMATAPVGRVPEDGDTSRAGAVGGGAVSSGGAPTDARPLHAGSGLTLLPTPTSRDHKGRNQRNDETCLTGALLPTPSVADAMGGHLTRSGDRSNELLLPGVARAYAEDRLLPTPMVGSTSPAAHGQISGDYRARMADALASWGDYGPAIARWESVIGRPAPAPTEPGKNGNPRLSPLFVEWLMGLPEGHVTDPAIGITRNDQLKALGNGVVPQQAAAATRALVEDMARAVVA